VSGLPKLIPAYSDDCVVASVTMVCMYWRVKRLDLRWNLPEDLEASEWDGFLQEGRRRVRQAGLPEGSLYEYLGELGLPLTVKYKQLFGLESIFSMLNAEIPPVPVFDRSFMFTGRQSYGHAGVVVGRTKELIVMMDPANAPRIRTEYSMREFSEAWKKRNNLTILIYPEDMQVQLTEVPSKAKTLTEFLG